MKALSVAAAGFLVCTLAQAQAVSPLFARGYTVLPQPQTVSLEKNDFSFDQNWRLKLGDGVRNDDVAVETLQQDLASRLHVALANNELSSPSVAAGGTLSLRLQPGSVTIGKALAPDKVALEEQAYRLDLHRGSVTITANAATGLFYGVETFLQLLRRDVGTLWLPEGTIEDWPDLQLRHIFWDDNHHLEKPEELKRLLRQAAFYKMNGFVMKLDGHFQYKSAAAAVEPNALSPAQLQELTNYGLRYHIQLIPFLDGPAHISFLLKHPEYAGLREFPDSNYEICATNPAAYRLLEGMYQDLLDANKGVKYFYLSTDEPYYLGLAHNAQCNEQDLANKLGSVGQVFSHFVEQTGGYLHERGRKVMFWGEYPLKVSDIPSLPSYLVNGEVYGPEFEKAYRQHGMQQMIYTSSEGEEKFFPDYSILPRTDRLHQGDSTDEFEDVPSVARLDSVTHTISFDSSRQNASLIGEINAGWSDEGVHPETFWLGYIASAAAGWHPGSPQNQELASSFYSLFYGPQVEDMDGVYRLMSEQAQTWTDTWDPIPSKARKPIWGDSYQIFKTPQPAHDQTLPLPPALPADLRYVSTWAADNARRVALARQGMRTNDILQGLLHENLQKARFNRDNLRIFVTIADFYRQNLAMLQGIDQIDGALGAAARLREKEPEKALEQVDSALDTAQAIWQQRNQVLANATATWEEGWYPQVAQANGRAYLDEADDVKDHLPARTTDLSYLVYREKLLPFGEWVHAIAEARNQYAAAHHLPAKAWDLSWEDLRVASQ